MRFFSSGLSLYFVLLIISILLVSNFIYWSNKDLNNYTQYRNAYSEKLMSLDVATIESKIVDSGFGTSTERFLTSYLIKSHPKSKVYCHEGNTNV